MVIAPPNESNGYLRVRCNGGLNQQRSAVRKLFCLTYDVHTSLIAEIRGYNEKLLK